MRLRLLVGVIFFVLLHVCDSRVLFAGRHVAPRTEVGTTLPAIFGAADPCPWVNLMRCALPLSLSGSRGEYVNPATIALDNQTKLPLNMTPGIIAKTVVQSGMSGSYEGGWFILTYNGNGTVSVGWDALPNSTSSGRLLFFVNPTNRGISVTINASSLLDPVQEISLVSVRYQNLTSRWNPNWVSLLSNFSVIKFSHWQQEVDWMWQGQPKKSWAERPSVRRFTYVWNDGVPHEEIVDLSRTIGCTAVVSVPTIANDDYLTQMASLYSSLQQKVMITDSYQNGYIAVPTRRVDRLLSISRIWKPIFASNSSNLEIILSLDVMSSEFMNYFDATNSLYNASFAEIISCVAVSGDIIVGAEPPSSVSPNPFFTGLAAYLNDTRRISWERMISFETDLVAYLGAWSRYNKSVVVLEGGITLATDMYGERFTNSSTTEAQIQVALERSLWDFELANPSVLGDLWTEYLERMYRMGVSLVLAGHFVHKGIECAAASTGFQFANRYQCYYRGLARFLDNATDAWKWRGVSRWKANENETFIASLVDAPPLTSLEPTCNVTCIWGVCGEGGVCECHAGYSGPSCDIFDATLLPNRCSPEDYGANLGGANDWDPMWIWTNFMHFARAWIHQPISGYVWSFDASSVAFPQTNADGWVTQLEADHAVSTFLRRDTYQYPQGIFHFFYEGDGTISFGMDTHVVRYVRNGHYIIQTIPQRQLNNGLFFQIRRVNPDNPIRNIAVVPESQMNRFRWQKFHPLFLDSLKRYRALRFMPLQRVQTDVNATVPDRRWSDRTQPAFFSQTAGRDGISWEHVIDLANFLHVVPWINIPYNAADDYVRNLTQLIRTRLNPRLKPIVEYGNEVWANDGYAGNYAQTQAILHGLDSGSWVVRARACWNQNRSRQIWRMMIADGVNVTRVLGAQAAYRGPAEEALKCDPQAAKEIDALAIAPYFGISLVSDSGILSLEDVFRVAQSAIDGSVAMLRTHVQLALANNISRVVCYEAGPSFFGGATSSDPSVQALGTQVHRDPRMKDLITDYFTALRGNGSSLHMYFNAPAGAWSTYGAWGIREYQNQDPATAFKLQGYDAYAVNFQSCTVNVGQCSTCSGHGTCMKDGTCECYFSYKGADCSTYWTIPDYNYCNTYLCPRYGGQCAITSRDGSFDIYGCVGCGSNRTGWMCQYPVCTNNCSFNGLCTAPQTCSCFRGHMGAQCETSCNCGGHGTCASNGSCTCDDGYRWNGSSCTPTCSCPTCQGPNLCGCSNECVYGACYNGTCRCWAGFSGATCSTLAGSRSSNAQSVMGINVAGIADWTSSIEFLNLMWRSRDWFLRPANVYAPSTQWSVDEPFNLTTDGYPAYLPFDRVASTFITRDTTYIPAGIYSVLWDGKGILDCGFDATIIASSRAVGYMKVQYTPTTVLNNGFLLTISATDPADPIRNIRVYSPEYPDDAVAKSLIFHPAFLNDLAPFRAIRFMDWVNLGNTYTVPRGTHERNWTQRNSVNASSMRYGYGVAEELMIALANWLNVEPWFSIPHDANDDYVRQFALLLKYRLRPDLAIQIEHSNEVWNGEFESYKYAVVRGRSVFTNITDPFTLAISWHGYRSQQIFSIFESVFGASQRNRLRFKVGTFALSTATTRTIMRYVTSRPVWVSSTGYFCDESFYGGAAAAAVLSVNTLISRCLSASTVNDTYIRQQAITAASLGAGLDLYESGPGLVEMSAIFGGYSAPGVADLYRQFHLHASMQTIVQNFFTMHRRLGVDQFNYFTSAARSSIYGNWGIKESTMQSCSSAPKCAGTMQWLAANPDPKARTINWGLSDFGYNNVIESRFTSAPTAQQLKDLVLALEQSLNLTTGSIVTQLVTSDPAPSNTSSATRRIGMELTASGNVTVLFFVAVDQGSARNVSQVASTVANVLPSTAAATTGINATGLVVVAAAPISPTTPLPTTNVNNGTATPPAPPTPPSSPTTPSPSYNLTSQNSAVGGAIGGAVGGVVAVAIVIFVWHRCYRSESTTSEVTSMKIEENGRQDDHVELVWGSSEAPEPPKDPEAPAECSPTEDCAVLTA